MRPFLQIGTALLTGTTAVAVQPAPQPVTFSHDVAPILFEHCATCHRRDEIGGFSLTTYQDVRPRATAIARATLSRVMPPWKPEPGYGDFVGARRLTDRDIETIQRWVADGAVEGDPSQLPPAPRFTEGWQLGQPDLVITLPEPYTLAAGGPDVLRSFVIPIPVTTTRYVKGVEFRPGNNRVVHHANMRVDRTSSSRLLDQADPEPGFDGRILTGSFPDGHFLGWTPGQLPPPAADTAWRLEPGSDLVVQLHLHPGGLAETVQPSIGLFFTDTLPNRVPMMLRLGRQNIDIPPGATEYVVKDSYALPVDVEVRAVQPHAHFRAKEIRGFATLPDGSKKSLIYIKDWDFNWQDVYRYAAPVALPKGSIVAMEYVYDNSSYNRRNPDSPPQRVRWGQNSADEMGDLWLQVLTRSNDERPELAADFGPKVIAEDAVGYETLLDVEPRNARLHDAAAAVYLSLGKIDKAVPHLTEALRINPDFAPAHYNLGTALARLNRLPEASNHFRRAAEIEPAFVAARVNLGAVLRLQNHLDEAAVELRQALQREPANAVAHTNLAGIFASQRKPHDAIAEYRLALQSNGDLLEPLAALAWILATSPDAGVRRPAEAVRLSRRAVELTGSQNVTTLDALAAAYAADGRFDQAIATEQRALELAEKAGTRDVTTALRSRLELYRRHKPFRDSTRAETPP
jgi:tetratricopeptide (TPR) repeat protein